MAIDTSLITFDNCPPRIKLNADYLVNVDTAQLNALDADDKAFYQYISTNIAKFGTPELQGGVYAKSVGVNFQAYLISNDTHLPLSFFYSISDIVNYGATVTNVPTTAASALVLTNNVGTIPNAGFVAGKALKAVFQAENNLSATDKGPLLTLDVIYAPAAPTTIAAADGVGQSVVTWDAMVGAASYDVYYIDDAVGTENAATIISTGTHFTGTVAPGGTTITGLTAGTCRVTVTATNPGGTSLGGAPDSATIS